VRTSLRRCLIALVLAAARSESASSAPADFRKLSSADVAGIEISVAPFAGGRGGAAAHRECLVFYAGNPSAGPRSTESLRSVAILGASLKVIWPIRTTESRIRALVDSVLTLPAVVGGPQPSNPTASLLLLRAAADTLHTLRAALDVPTSRLLFSKMRAVFASDRGTAATLHRLACEWGLVPLTSATEVTSLVTVESNVLRREKSGIVDVKVRVTNDSEDFLAGPITLVVGGALSGFVDDPDGFTCTARPAGRAFVTLSARNGLAPANAIGGVIRLKNPPPGEVNLQARVFSGSATP